MSVQQAKDKSLLKKEKAEKRQLLLRQAGIKLDSTILFKVDARLIKFLSLKNEWQTYKELLCGFFDFHQKVGNFYDKKTTSFNLELYPVFAPLFPGSRSLTKQDVQNYLLKKEAKEQ